MLDEGRLYKVEGLDIYVSKKQTIPEGRRGENITAMELMNYFLSHDMKMINSKSWTEIYEEIERKRPTVTADVLHLRTPKQKDTYYELAKDMIWSAPEIVDGIIAFPHPRTHRYPRNIGLRGQYGKKPMLIGGLTSVASESERLKGRLYIPLSTFPEIEKNYVEEIYGYPIEDVVIAKEGIEPLGIPEGAPVFVNHRLIQKGGISCIVRGHSKSKDPYGPYERPDSLHVAWEPYKPIHHLSARFFLK